MKIPFDIELAKLALAAGTGKIVTKKGDPVEITCWNGTSGIWPVVGKVDGASCDEMHWTEEGKWFDLWRDTDFDLFIETDLDI